MLSRSTSAGGDSRNNRSLRDFPTMSLPTTHACVSSPTAADQNSRKPLICKQSFEDLLLQEAGYNCSSTDATPKRSDYISWDDYFMAVAALSALRSKDPFHATGACLVDKNNRVIGTGYNGFPSGCSDDFLPWHNFSSDHDGEAPSWLHTKVPFEVHAEVNAILNKCAADCDGARLYTQYFPCNECAKVIIQSRISEIVYVHMQRDSKNAHVDSNSLNESICASRILFTMAGVRMRQFKPACKFLDLKLWKALDANEQTFAEVQTSKIVTVKTVPTMTAVDHADLLRREANYDPITCGSIKRTDNLSWDDYFMSMAFLTAQRSKDPNSQVGACIVDVNKRIVGLGYNGFPARCSDDILPWAREGTSELHKKYMYVCHAEMNAILNKGSADVRGSIIYVALFPCHECSKVIIQAGIQEVVYMSDRYHDTESCRASRIMLEMAGVTLRKYIPVYPSVTITLDEVDRENHRARD